MRLKATVAIVGAGTAGAATALLCARAGVDTLVIERRPLADAGAHWLNAVPGWAFDESGIARSEGAELVSRGHAFHLVAGWGPSRVTVTDHDVLEVDMRALVHRLQAEARAAGARFADEVRVRSFTDGRLMTTAGAVTARWFVDASGFGGAGLMPTPDIARADVCAATQRVYAITDHAAARAWFEARDVTPGDTLCYASVAGGFSIVNARIERGGLAVLSGSIPARGYPSGRALQEAFVAELPWVGEVLSGGSSPIPLRRPFTRLATERVALIGDAACQVFAAHGSGIGAQLVAARILADALAAGDGPLAYERRWQRTWGGLFAAYDLFRRYSEGLSAEALSELIEAGVMRPDMVRDGMVQRWPKLGPRRLVALLAAARRRPGPALRIAPVVARMGLARALYAAYPRSPRRIPAWDRAARRLLGG